MRRYIEERQRYINQTGKHYHVLVVPGDRTDCAYSGRSVVHRIHSPKIDRSCDYRALINLGRVREIISSERPDLIECADPYQLAWMIARQSRELKIPAVAFYHSHFPEACFGFARRFGTRLASWAVKYSQLYAKHLYNRFRQTLVPSPALAAVLNGWGVRNVRPVSLGVDTAIFTPGPRNEERRAVLNLRPDQILLLYVGRLSYEKNLWMLVKAFEHLSHMWPNKYRLHLIGEGSLKADLLNVTLRQPSISLQAYVSDTNELVQNYLAADIFVHPGIHETFGLVTLEAQACGLPVVGIRGTFMDRLALNGNHYWADENTPESLALAISRFSALPRREIGMRAALRAHADYSWPQVFHHLFNLYEGVLSKR